MSQYTTLTQMFENTFRAFGDREFFFTKNEHKHFIGVTFKDAFIRSENAGIGLMQLGLKPQEKVGLMADNRLEWAIADMAVLLNGAVDVPRGTDSTHEEIKYILNHSESRFCFVENEATLKKMLPIISETQVEKLIILDPSYKSSDEKIMNLADLVKDGEKHRKEKLAELKTRAANVRPDDLYTIIYTSGTTGMPKGVMLSHTNMVYNIVEVPKMVGMVSDDKMLSILPVWHIFERAMDYGAYACGIPIYYTSVRDLKDDFQRVKPTFMASAPRVWESIYAGIMAKLEKAEPQKRMLFELGYNVTKTYKKALDYLNGNELTLKPETEFEKLGKSAMALFTVVNLFVATKLLDNIIFSKLREAALGGKMRGTISGGGALPAHVDEFFNVIGIPVYEGYGMTECSPIISARSEGHSIQGSVGFTPQGTEVRILNDKGKKVGTGEIGVIHVRGPQVMKGYYKNEEATKKTIDKDGWLNTGDLGFISYNNTVSVRGRAKDTIVLLGGENIEPVPIENKLLENTQIHQVIVVGQDKKALTALIWPDIEKVKEAGISINSSEDMNKNSALKDHFSKIIRKQISTDNGFKGFEKITDFRFLPKPMEVGDEITNLLKMKRNVIFDKYKTLIDSMY